MDVPDGTDASKYVVFYLPENIDFDELLKQYPPDFRLKDYHAAYILHLIYSIPASNKKLKLKATNGFTPINRQLLQSVVKHYSKYIRWLEQSGVVVSSDHYIVGKQSKGLKFTRRYATRMIRPIYVTKSSYVSRFHGHLMYNQDAQSVVGAEFEYLRRCWNAKLTIDINSTCKELDATYIVERKVKGEIRASRNRNIRLIPALRISTGSYKCEPDSTIGRFHTPLTQLKTDFRKYLSYGGEELYELDVKNCQPYLSAILLRPDLYQINNVGEIIQYYRNTTPSKFKGNKSKLQLKVDNWSESKYYELIQETCTEADVGLFLENLYTGNLYEFMRDSLGLANRKAAKDACLISMFAPNSSIGSRPEMRQFRKLFPNVYQAFSEVKRGRNRHHAMSCALQAIEADVVLRDICKHIASRWPECPMFTIHDSICTTKRYVNRVYDIMIEGFVERFEKPPMIHIQKLGEKS